MHSLRAAYMRAISTRDLAGMPDIPALRRLTQSLAVLDAILSPEWENRYYSFDSRWGLETYVSFAAEYYGTEIPLEVVADVYRHTRLTRKSVARLNPAVLLTDLAPDLAEIGYPDTRP